MIIKLEDLDENLFSKISNKIFIYPTDTIYGLGCNAQNQFLVNKIRKIKNRDNTPFSIIVPSIEYILKHFDIDKKIIEKYLPGPYTLLVKKKYKNFLNHVSNNEYIGIRIPDHLFTKILQKINKPMITTSVNLSGEKPTNNIKDIDTTILGKVDFVIDAGELSGKPSTLIKDDKIVQRNRIWKQKEFK